LIQRLTHIAIWTLSCSSVLFGQEPADTTIRTFETSIVIIKTEDLPNVSAPTVHGESLSEQQILQRTPEDLGDLTSSFSGVFVRSYGGAGGLKTMNARGLGSQHFLLISNSQAMLFNQMGSANLGDVQVDGLLSVQYSIGGTDNWRLPALAKTYSGVLALGYKDQFLLEKRNQGNIQVLGGSFGRMKLSGNWYKSAEKWALFSQVYGYRMAGAYPFSYQHGFVQLDGTRFHNHTQEAAARLGGVLKLNDKNLLHLSTQYLNAHRELPGAIVFYHPDVYQTLANQQLNVNLKHDYTGKSLSLLNYANYSWTKTDYRDPFTQFGFPFQIYMEQNSDLGHNGHFWYKSLRFNWSAQYVYSELFTSRGDIMLPRRQRAIVNLGSQYFRGRFTVRADVPFQFLSDQIAFNPYQNRVIFTPSFGLSHVFVKKENVITVLRASAGQFARVATFSEMYYGAVGNPNLRPEVSQMINLGFHHSRRTDKWNWGFGVDAFGGIVKDKIIAVPTQNLFVWSVRNVQTVQTYGFDAKFNFTYNLNQESNLHLNLKSSLNVAHDVSDESSSTYQQQIPYTPYWLHSAELSYKYKRLSLTYQYSFNDFRFVLGENITANVLDEFHLHDLRVNYEGKMKAESKYGYRFHAKCNNLLNSQYQVMRGFPMPGRNFEIGLTFFWK
jgi:vitamin B12 transporter